MSDVITSILTGVRDDQAIESALTKRANGNPWAS
jgi:hypothetical protein